MSDRRHKKEYNVFAEMKTVPAAGLLKAALESPLHSFASLPAPSCRQQASSDRNTQHNSEKSRRVLIGIHSTIQEKAALEVYQIVKDNVSIMMKGWCST